MRRQGVSACLGLWLMAAPAVLGYGGLAANASWVIGPLLASTAFLASFAIARPLRWANPLLGALLVGVTLFATDFAATVNAVVVGVAVTSLALRTPRAATNQYGGGWASLLDDEHARDRG